MTGLDGRNALDLPTTLMLVYMGAAVAALVAAALRCHRSKAAMVPSGTALGRIAASVPLVAFGAALFWYVALEVSILVATAALPIKVIVERFATGRLFGQGAQPKARQRARAALDVPLAMALLLTGVLASSAGQSWSHWDSLLVAALVAGGVVSEVVMLAVQQGANRNRAQKPLEADQQVLFTNLGLGLLFGAAFVVAPFGTAAADLTMTWQMLALPLVGAAGVAVPGMLRLGLFKAGIAAPDLAMLALGFPGAAYIAKAVIAAGSAILGWITGLTLPPVAIVATSSGWSQVDLILSVIVAVFIVDRLAADQRGDGPRGGPGGTDRLVKVPRSLTHRIDTGPNAAAGRTYLAAEAAYLALPVGAPDRLHQLEVLTDSLRPLGLAAYLGLPPALLKRLKRLEAAGMMDADLVAHLDGFVAARRYALSDAWSSKAALRDGLQRLHAAHVAIIKADPGATAAAVLWAQLTFRGLRGLERLSSLVGRWTAPASQRLLDVRGQTGLERWSHRLGRFISQFLTYEALLLTGVETSWGFRFVIPGTGGVGINAGGWVMFYSGSLMNYLTMSVPMRINPGATLATAVFVWTVNRPGVGAGPSMPWASAYVDAQRYKLLIGIDGVGYGRIGEWKGRGPYATISGSLPFVSGIRITWNASVFSPGFLPMVEASTPYAERLQDMTERMQLRVLGLFKR